MCVSHEGGGIMNNQEYAMIIAKNLRRIFYHNGKAQADVSRALGISKATLSSWMNGTRIPRIDKIDLLCHYFNVPRSAIMEPHDDQDYYIEEEAKDLAQFLKDNPEYKILFDASRKVKREDLEKALKAVNIFIDD